MKEIIVSLMNVEKVFGANRVVKNLNMEIQEGEFLTMLGPSGCGKTTTLRMIAGFEDATSGVIKVEGERVEEKEAFERNVNTVFQNYALFPHMTIFDNVAYGLTVKKLPKNEIKKRVTEMLEMVQLTGFEKRKPNQLSGGQKQRVAIARALINRPKVLLLDEPLGALDMKLRKQMQLELKRLQKKLNITFIYVTHDQEEALTMSDRIAIMNNGSLEQIGTPQEIYDKPKTKFVADFIGESNIMEGLVIDISGDIITVATECGNVKVKGKGFVYDEFIHVCIRPENIKYGKTHKEGFTLKGVVKEHIYVGSIVKTILYLPNGDEVKVNHFASEKLEDVNTVLSIYWDPENAVPIKRQDDKLVDFLEERQKEVFA